MSDATSSSSVSAASESGGSAKKTAALLRELNDELEEEKKKRFKLERCEWGGRVVCAIVATDAPLPLGSRSGTKTK
jgi:hypothetical protein